MRKIYSFILLAALNFAFIVQLNAQPYYSLETVKVADDIYMLKAANVSAFWVTGNITVIINEDDVFVVDSGLLPSVGDMAIAAIKKLTNKPVRYLFNTHWHGDHWQGNESFRKAFPSIQIITTEENLRNIKRFGMLWVKKNYRDNYEAEIKAREKELVTNMSRSGDSLSKADKKELTEDLPYNKKELEEMNGLNPVFPDVTFSKEMTLVKGTREIEMLYLGIGNTSGDGIVYLPKEKILISGDLVVYPSPYESGNFSREWLETLRKLNSFDFNYLLPGHGPVFSDHKYLSFLIDMFGEIISRVNKEVDEGKSLEETQKEVTYKAVMDTLSQHPEYADYIKNIDPSFISTAILRAYPKARESKL